MLRIRLWSWSTVVTFQRQIYTTSGHLGIQVGLVCTNQFNLARILKPLALRLIEIHAKSTSGI